MQLIRIQNSVVYFFHNYCKMKTNQKTFLTTASIPCNLHVNLPQAGRNHPTFVVFSGIVLLWERLLLCCVLFLCHCISDNPEIAL